MERLLSRRKEAGNGMEETVAFCLGWRFAADWVWGGARMKVERVGIKGWRVLTNVGNVWRQ